MKIKYTIYFIVIICSGIFASTSLYAFLSYFKSTELIENSKRYDKETIFYKGEVIGDILIRGNTGWINVNDGENAMGIFFKTELLPSIKYVGSYKNKGDIVSVEGVFNRTCKEHNGEMDIHAEKITILEDGYIDENLFDYKKLYVTVLLVAVFILLLSIRTKSENKKIRC